jgi:hypothetical protein
MGARCVRHLRRSPVDLLAITMNASRSGSLRKSVAVPPASAGSCASGNLELYQVSYGNSATPPDLQICQRQRRALLARACSVTFPESVKSPSESRLAGLKPAS